MVAGIGAGQAVEAFLKGKRTTIAILKSLGAERALIFRIYLPADDRAVSALGLLRGRYCSARCFLLPSSISSATGFRCPPHYALYAGPLVLAAAFGAFVRCRICVPPLARACDIAPAGLFRDLVAPSRIHARWRYLTPRPLRRLQSSHCFPCWFRPSTAVQSRISWRCARPCCSRCASSPPDCELATCPVHAAVANLRLAISSLTRPGTPVAGTDGGARSWA